MRRSVVRTVLSLVITSATAQVAYAQPASCTTVGQNLYVRDVMTDLYLWYAEIPDLDPALFDSPEAYLEAVRYRPLDSTFSYITSRAASEAFFSNSQFIGFGLSTSLTSAGMRVLQVFPESPAEEAGLSRGDRIEALDGVAIPELVATGRIDEAFGPSEEGVAVEVAWLTLAGERRSARLVKRLVTIPTVSLTRVYEVDGRRVGYIFFRNFVEPSTEALDAAFNDLNAAGIDDLVLDLRYNGGGLVQVARHLGSLIGGVRTRGQVFAEYFHNDKNAFRNRTLRFEDPPNAGVLQRLIVITTRASASASELIINALRPFMPVVVIGDRTYGKPVGQYAIGFCDKLLAPVAFVLRNAVGDGSYFDGFPPDCAAPDDADRQLGDPAEASLREALTFAATGACSPGARGLQRLEPAREAQRLRGWRALVNAY